MTEKRKLNALQEIEKRDFDGKDHTGADRVKLGEELLALAQEIDSKIWVAKAQAAIGKGFIELADYEKSLLPLSQAIALYSELDDIVNLVRCRSDLENSNTFLGKTEQGFVSRVETLRLAKKTNDHKLITNALIRIANDSMFLGNTAKSLEYLEEALAVANKNNLIREIQNCHLGLSEIAKISHDLDGFLYHAEEALRLAGDTSDRAWKARLLLQVSQAKGGHGLYRESIPFAQEALMLATNNVGKSHAHRILADTYRELKEFDQAENHALTALSLAQESKHALFTGSAEFLLGRIKNELGDHQSAIPHFMEAAQIGTSISNHTLGCTSNQLLAMIYKEINEFEKALHFFELFKENHEKHESEETRLRLKTLESALEVERSHKETELANLRAQQTEKELANSTLQLIAQTELLSELRDGLLKFIRKFPMPDGAAKELRERLKTLPCKAVDWEKFDTQFKAAHPEFTKKLLEKYPELSPTELRICLLVRMNLKSEDIARLLCLSERTVENHRNHIRQKMKLKRSEELAIVLAKM